MTMKLTLYEQEMLDGQYGWPVQKGMEILYRIGEIYGAEKMLPVQNVHMVNASVSLSGKAAVLLAEKMCSMGAKFKTNTTLNPASVDLDCWRKIGFPESMYKQQKHLTELYTKMGAIPLHCCTPYLAGQVPRFGEHICWGESSAVIYANSVLGARTNRNGGPLALSASLTGVVPAYGYHLDENRYGQILIEVNTDLNEADEYGLLGFFVGEIVTDGVPVFTGIPKNVSLDKLKMLGSALATSGAVAMFHVEGVTPEAPTIKDAFGPNTPEKVIRVGEKELEETSKRLREGVPKDISIVYIGCPHASIHEIAEIAELLRGKKIKEGIEVWVTTGQPIRALAERCGYLSTIEEAGAYVVADTCLVHCLLKEFRDAKGYKAMATNSPKMAHYGWNVGGIPTGVYSVKECIEIALSDRVYTEGGA